MERYLPLFNGAEYNPTSEQKRFTHVLAELEEMSNIAIEEFGLSIYRPLQSGPKFPVQGPC